MLRRFVSYCEVQLRESERLKAELQQAYEQLRGKDAKKAEQLALKLAEVERQHATALKALFGSSSEKRSKGEAKVNERKPQKGHGRKGQTNLPIQDVRHVYDNLPIASGVCGSELVEWKDQYEGSEEIDFVPPQLILKRHLRQEYRCTCGACVQTAPGPQKLFAKARYSVNFAVQKYAYHKPLARQVRAFEHQGLSVTSATLWAYLSTMYDLLLPAHQRLEAYMLSQPLMGIDETRWKLLKTEQKGKSKAWWGWVRRVHDAVHYTLDPSRGNDVAIWLLRDFKGAVIADGYRPYEVALKHNPHMKLANCWSHARREVLPFEADPRGARVLRVIQRMYRLEAIAKERALSPPDLLRFRQRKTKPSLSALFSSTGTVLRTSKRRLPAAADAHCVLNACDVPIARRSAH